MSSSVQRSSGPTSGVEQRGVKSLLGCDCKEAAGRNLDWRKRKQGEPAGGACGFVKDVRRTSGSL